MIYFIFISFFSIFVFFHNCTKENKENINLYYLFVFVVALVLGLRGNEDEYTRLFLIISPLDEFFTKEIFFHEKGFLFVFIVSIFKTLSLNSQSIFLVCSFTGVLLHAYFFRKYTKYYFLAFLLYLSHEICFKEWNGLRMGVASALLLPMIYYLEQGKKINFFILLVVATLIQYVAILSLFLLFMNKRLDPKLLWGGLIFAIFFMQTHLVYNFIWFIDGKDLLPSIVSSYLSAEVYVYNASIFHLKTIQQLLVISVLIILFGYKKNLVSGYYTLLFNAYYLGTIFLILFSDLSLFAFRFNGHFYSVEPILITYVIMSFKQKKLVSNSIALFALVVAFMNYVYLERIDQYDFLVNTDYYLAEQINNDSRSAWELCRATKYRFENCNWPTP